VRIGMKKPPPKALRDHLEQTGKVVSRWKKGEVVKRFDAAMLSHFRSVLAEGMGLPPARAWEEIGIALGVSAGRMSRWRQGKDRPGFDVICRYLSAMDYQVEVLGTRRAAKFPSGRLVVLRALAETLSSGRKDVAAITANEGGGIGPAMADALLSDVGNILDVPDVEVAHRLRSINMLWAESFDSLIESLPYSWVQ
jgi:transcriptional regulator with XRE-family HTH domain